MSHDTTIQNDTSNEISQWHLTIKTVSSEHAPFTIPINPKDTLDTLQRIITEHTNLQPTQQRLIYRGRMLNVAVNSSNGEDCTIDSVDGLCDGQTIHLVPRPAGIPPSNSNSNSNSNQEEEEDNNEMFAEYTAMQMGAGGDPTETIMGEMFSRAVLAEEGGLEVSLLSLLLGATSTFGTTNNNNTNRNGNRRSSIISDMRLSNEDDEEDNEGDESEQINNGNSWRRRSFSIPSTSLDRNSIRRGGSNAANLSSDAQQPNSTNNQQQQQGSAMEPLEPIRQNLMTLNTMLRHHDANLAEVSVDSIDANRRFYRGQWIDCLDTVNQWLEATVIDVVDASDLLVDNGNGNGDEANLATNDVASDEGISALEDVQSNTIRSSTAFREQAREPLIRSTNLAGRNQLLQLRDERTDTPRSDCVQLLLVHYNGWPSETWDEWIRSDSHRIRPFRTRTVHRSIGPQNPNGAMSPSVQNPVLPVHAPRTHVALEEEANLITSPADDRLGVLQEVTQTLGDVQGVLNRYVHPNLQSNDNDNDQINSRQLPWRTNTDTDNSTNPMMTRREELRIIAPLLDRLGRALVDIAPQLADLAEEPTSTDPLLPNNNNNTANNDQEEMEEAEGLSGLFDDTTPPSDVNHDANHSDFVHAMVHTRNTNTNTSNTNTATLHNLRSNANTNTNTASNVTVTDAGFLGPLLAAAAQGGGRVFRQGADGRTTEIQIQVGMGPTLEEHNRNDDNDRNQNRNSNGNRNRQSDDSDSAPRDRSNDQRAEEAMHELYEEDGVMDAPLGTVQQQRNLQANLADEADDNEDDDDTGSLPPLLSNYTSSSMGSNQSSDFGDDDVSDDVSSDAPPALLDYSDEDSIYIEVHTNRYPDNDDDHEEESEEEDSMPPLDDNYDCYSSSDSNSSDVSSSSSSEDEDMPALESIPIETKGNIPDDVSSSSSSDEEDGDASSSKSDEDMPVLEAIDDTNIARSVNASCAVVVDTPAPVSSSSLSLISPAASSDDVRIDEEEEEDEGRSISSVDTSSSGEVVVAAKRVRRAADSVANEDESVNAVVGAATTMTATGVVGGTRRSVVSPSRWGGIFRRFSSSSSPSPSN
eukprot:CAMPEP_0116022758 /NCGR_PEP_ID=MMETSP0321-20121206/11174_1 /TAXON_ID=163516 /ORGANISM="Leptocylindrus danicus var. danicus, Strain B650" /LENGTH=1090 /DNA_ID=CAMNT_0003493883 /DNA_START=712 /DNA_END=3984 /DNA_ORIENTATION=+